MNNVHNSLLSRRELFRRSLVAGSAYVAGLHHVPLPRFLALPAAEYPADSSFLGLVPFSDEGHPPMQQLIGTELDGRLFTDLASLTPENPLITSERFFVRTRASNLMDTSKPWAVQIGAATRAITIPIATLVQKSRHAGVHLMECSGNTRTAQFGLLSIAAWEGVPLHQILDEAKPRFSGARVLVSGFDRYQDESMTSEPGASWIFTPEQLFSSRAFLATKMNGKSLSPDHGAPLRLLVPGWYGCVCIKWVNQIDYVPDDAPATSQMQEYATRTTQTGVPGLAREYRPAAIQPAAMATRIEKWRIAKKIKYFVAGIQWGGQVSQPKIAIRFNPDEPFVRIQNFRSGAGCSFWIYDWSPARVGKFTIRLQLNATDTTAHRLNSGYYDRSVEVTEI